MPARAGSGHSLLGQRGRLIWEEDAIKKAFVYLSFCSLGMQLTMWAAAPSWTRRNGARHADAEKGELHPRSRNESLFPRRRCGTRLPMGLC